MRAVVEVAHAPSDGGLTLGRLQKPTKILRVVDVPLALRRSTLLCDDLRRVMVGRLGLVVRVVVMRWRVPVVLGLVPVVMRQLVPVVRRLVPVMRWLVPMVRWLVPVVRWLVLAVFGLVLAVFGLMLMSGMRRGSVLHPILRPVPVSPRQRSVVVVPKFLVQRGVQSRPNLKACQPQRAQEQRVNPTKSAMSKEKHGKERNPTRVPTTIRTQGASGSI